MSKASQPDYRFILKEVGGGPNSIGIVDSEAKSANISSVSHVQIRFKPGTIEKDVRQIANLLNQHMDLVSAT